MTQDILIVDDSKDMLEVVGRQLTGQGFNTFQATNVMDAVDLLKLSIPKLLITDIQMPGVDGGKLVKYVQKHFPKLPVLVITGYPSSKEAKEVLEGGEVSYLTKPFTQKELGNAVKSLIKTQTEGDPNAGDNPSEKLKGFIGSAKSLASTYHLIDKIKDNKVTVLITGESGTGKELVARGIHMEGKFRDKPFIAVNCGAIQGSLLEAELYGYEKGAFTGATTSKEGLFFAANQGTIFLDEIGNAPSQVQQSLLRVIQQKEVLPVGGRKPIKIDVRIIAATNSNLIQMVENGEFREDLYYRLNVVNIKLPPLRDRMEDLKSLVGHFMEKYATDLGRREVAVNPEVWSRLKQHDWPGNIRELENVIHYALVVCEDEIQCTHLPQYLIDNSTRILSPKLGKLKSLKTVELEHIRLVLAHCGNNKSRAAEILGITRKTLAQKLQ